METPSKQPLSWFAERTGQGSSTNTMSRALCELLVSIGVRQAFGIVGGGNAPLAEALLTSDIELIHTRHEGGAAFAAAEASLSSGKPAIVFVTTGPGLLNALTGIVGARWEGARVVLLSGMTSPSFGGRGAVQETSSYTMPGDGLFRAGAFFDYAVQLVDVAELPQIARRLDLGCQHPSGFVAHIALPLSMQTTLAPRARSSGSARIIMAEAGPTAIDACAERLRGGHFAVWLGYGARTAAGAVRTLVERTGAAVMCTPRAKGIFPERHPQYVGITGAAGHDNVLRYMDAIRPRETLVLGTQLGEGSSYWARELVPEAGLIHVDLNLRALGTAYPETSVLAIQAEIRGFVERLAGALPVRCPPTDIAPLTVPSALEPRATGPIRPQYLMQQLQQRIVDGSDAIVLSEAGSAFGWANHFLRFSEPGRYRTSVQYGSMGQATAGVVGAALGRHGKAVAIVGDGAMLMNGEVSTAVKYGAQAVWVVLRDDRYGITHQGMAASGFIPVDTELPLTDFAAMAVSVGAAGVGVRSEADLPAALEQAMGHDGPFVIDVHVDRDEISPVLEARVQGLRQQEGATADSGPARA